MNFILFTILTINILLMVFKIHLVEASRSQLHVHLDGSVTEDTLFNITIRRNLSLPTIGIPKSASEIGTLITLNFGFKAFDIINNIIGGDVESLEMAAADFVDTQAQQNITYTEVRYDAVRASYSSYAGTNITQEEAVNAIRNGLLKGMIRNKDKKVVVNQLLCAMRGKSSEECLSVVALVSKMRNVSLPGSVVGIDLAGDEWEYHNGMYIDCFRTAKKLGLNTTVHAGETLPFPLSYNHTASELDVYTAAVDMQVDRIGHGYKASKNNTIMGIIRDKNIHVEACPETAKGEGSLSAIKDYINQNISFSLSTDDPCIGCKTPRPLEVDEELTGFNAAQIQHCHDEARKHAFGNVEFNLEQILNAYNK